MRNLINGQELHASNGNAIEVINPARNQLIATVPKSTIIDVTLTINAAQTAQKKWEATSIYERAKILKQFATLVEENFEILATTISRESGKTITEARKEVSTTKDIVDGCIKKATELLEIKFKEKNKESEAMIRQPLGIVACIIPFNMQLEQISQQILCALIMGNSLIVNPPLSNPLTIHKYCLLLKEAGIPNGVINCISGIDKNIIHVLLCHKEVNLIVNEELINDERISISTENKNVSQKTYNDFLIVAADANLDIAVRKALEERLYNAGQSHGFSKRFLVHYSIKDEFVQKIIEQLRKIKVGDPLYISTELGCLINENAAIKVEEQVRATLAEGAILAFGGRRMQAFFEPTVLVNVKKDMSIMKDMEILGPIIPICGFTTIGEAIEIANQSTNSLCGKIITKDINNAMKAASMIDAKSVVIYDDNNFENEHIPFGCWKHSNISSENISLELQRMSKIKNITIKNN